MCPRLYTLPGGKPPTAAFAPGPQPTHPLRPSARLTAPSPPLRTAGATCRLPVVFFRATPRPSAPSPLLLPIRRGLCPPDRCPHRLVTRSVPLTRILLPICAPMGSLSNNQYMVCPEDQFQNTSILFYFPPITFSLRRWRFYVHFHKTRTTSNSDHRFVFGTFISFLHLGYLSVCCLLSVAFALVRQPAHSFRSRIFFANILSVCGGFIRCIQIQAHRSKPHASHWVLWQTRRSHHHVYLFMFIGTTLVPAAP